MELRTFLELNEGMALRALLDQVQAVERVWDEEDERRQALATLLDLLDGAALHRSSILRDLSAMGRRIPDDPSYHQFLALFVPIERQHGRMVADADFMVRSVDQPSPGHSSRQLPLILILDNIRSAFNVGSILRTAESLGLVKVYLCGYTARPDHDRVAKSALGAESKVAWEWVAHAEPLLLRLRSEQVRIYGLETAAKAEALEESTFPYQSSALLVGNERYGLEAKLLQHCHALIEIPAWGSKNSLNVAVSAGMACFEMRRQWWHQNQRAVDPQS